MVTREDNSITYVKISTIFIAQVFGNKIWEQVMYNPAFNDTMLKVSPLRLKCVKILQQSNKNKFYLVRKTPPF